MTSIFAPITGYDPVIDESDPMDGLLRAFNLMEQVDKSDYMPTTSYNPSDTNISSPFSFSPDSRVMAATMPGSGYDTEIGLVPQATTDPLAKSETSSLMPGNITPEGTAMPQILPDVNNQSSFSINVGSGGGYQLPADQGTDAQTPAETDMLKNIGAAALSNLPSLLLSGGEYALPALAIGGEIAGKVRGAHEGYDDYKKGHGKQQSGVLQMGNAFSPLGSLAGFNEMLGKPINSNDMTHIAGLLNPVFPIRLLTLADIAGINFWSGKGEDQQNRDVIRETLQDNNILDKDWKIKLSDGSTFDMGQDNGTKDIYNIDWTKDVNQDVLGPLNALAAIFAQDSGKSQNDFAGMLYNAAMSGGDPMKNVGLFFNYFNLDRNSAWQSIDQLVKEEKLSQEYGDAFKAGIDKYYGVKP